MVIKPNLRIDASNLDKGHLDCDYSYEVDQYDKILFFWACGASIFVWLTYQYCFN